MCIRDRNTWGATVIASPSRNTNSGRSILEQDPDSPGSLGIAISEAVERAATTDGINYALGSVLNHVLLHQTCLLYTSDAADERSSVDLGGRRIINKKKKNNERTCQQRILKKNRA